MLSLLYKNVPDRQDIIARGFRLSCPTIGRLRDGSCAVDHPRTACRSIVHRQTDKRGVSQRHGIRRAPINLYHVCMGACLCFASFTNKNCSSSKTAIDTWIGTKPFVTTASAKNRPLGSRSRTFPPYATDTCWSGGGGGGDHRVGPTTAPRESTRQEGKTAIWSRPQPPALSWFSSPIPPSLRYNIERHSTLSLHKVVVANRRAIDVIHSHIRHAVGLCVAHNRRDIGEIAPPGP